MEVVALFGLAVLYGTMALRVERPDQLVAQLFWRTATARPPVLIVATVMGWAGVMACAAQKRLRVDKVIGTVLEPAKTFRCAIVLLNAVLACRLVPVAAAAVTGRRDSWSILTGDIAAYACCVVALLMPPSRLFSSGTSSFDAPERSAAHGKYGHGLASETSFARNGLATALWDTLLAPFAPPVTFWHVIVADYATSLAKGLGDAHVTTCVAANALFFQGSSSSRAREKSHSVWWEARRGACASSLLNASALALPFWCRLFQCLMVFRETRHPKNLWNALKYATAFPLIYVGYLEKNHPGEYRFLFVCAAILQSSATFAWDVLVDWALYRKKQNGLLCGLFETRFRSSLVPSLFAPGLLIAFDFCLRFVWALAVFGDFSTRGAGLFFFELAEILRRTVWALFRIEWELIDKNHQQVRPADGSEVGAADGIAPEEGVESDQEDEAPPSSSDKPLLSDDKPGSASSTLSV